MKRLQFILLLILPLIFLLTTSLSGCLWKGKPVVNKRDRSLQTPANCPLDGLPTSPESINRRPLAVMIENSPRARPQSGLTSACVVYEAITEGGITRFLAVYLHGNPSDIGPVRSARPHFIQMVREYQAAYVHCGESYEALQILTRDPVLHIDQMRYEKSFWRDHTRIAPHNLFTSSEKIRKLIEELGWEFSVDQLPSFTSNSRLETGESAEKIDISFPGAVNYKLRLVYDKKLGGYTRYMDGKLHVDRETNAPVVAKNVIIQRVYAAPFEESKTGTIDVEMVGAGEGLFLSNGKQQPLQWMKSNSYSITSFTDDQNAPLPFMPGQTWIEVVPEGGKVTID